MGFDEPETLPDISSLSSERMETFPLIARITSTQAAGLADVGIDEYRSENGCITRTRLKLGAKTRALALLRKHLGVWTCSTSSELFALTDFRRAGRVSRRTVTA